jgi:hypothetical protein
MQQAIAGFCPQAIVRCARRAASVCGADDGSSKQGSANNDGVSRKSQKLSTAFSTGVNNSGDSLGELR